MIKKRVAEWRSGGVAETRIPRGFFFATPRLCDSASTKGIIALMTVIIIGAMILAVGISAALIGHTEIVLSGQSDRQYAARSIAIACADEALHRLKLNSGYTGGTVPIGSGACTASVSGGGSTRTITVTASSAEFTKSVVITASLKQNVAATAQAWHMDSWTEGDPL